MHEREFVVFFQPLDQALEVVVGADGIHTVGSAILTLLSK